MLTLGVCPIEDRAEPTGLLTRGGLWLILAIRNATFTKSHPRRSRHGRPMAFYHPDFRVGFFVLPGIRAELRRRIDDRRNRRGHRDRDGRQAVPGGAGLSQA